MKALLDISAAVQQGAGVGRYTRELAEGLLSLSGRPDLTFLYNRHGAARPPVSLAGVPSRVVPLGNKQYRLALLLSHLLGVSWDRWLPQCDLFHGPDVIAPPMGHTPTVITVHDLSFLRYPQFHRPLNRWNLRWITPYVVRRAAAVIADSQSTRRDLVELVGTAPHKVHVIFPGVASSYHVLPAGEAGVRVRHRFGLDGGYILFVGTIEPRKNLETLIEACRQLSWPAPLVIAGRAGWRAQRLSRRLQALEEDGRVRLLGYVPDDDLPLLYNAAKVFAYPSWYEGFGLPVLEAMACGTPVVTSNVSSLPEVAGQAALLVHPGDAGALAEALARVLRDETLAADLRTRGLARAQAFSWQRTVRETAALYRQIAGGE
ncbi:MAG: glycosyltransferase family 4 protein [Chloroflexi bacterium]|nr:glycosyltransferase family 4 protein [Chloroflexota bacterium]